MIVIADKPGQLGNMLFLFAHFIARAHESGFSVSNPAFEDYADCFPSTAPDLFSRFPAAQSATRSTRALRHWFYLISNLAVRAIAKLGGNLGFIRTITLYDWNAEFSLADPAFIELARSRTTVLVRGWGFRDAAALQRQSDRIRDFFQPFEHNRRNIEELIARARLDGDLLVGVHIRHGIIHFDNTRRHFYTAKRYAEMMDEVRSLFPGRRVNFLICSDWPQDPWMFSKLQVTFGTGDLIEDMYALARCDYLIGPPSTFTMWASFYGKVPLNIIRRSDQSQQLSDFIVLEGLI